MGGKWVSGPERKEEVGVGKAQLELNTISKMAGWWSLALREETESRGEGTPRSLGWVTVLIGSMRKSLCGS